MVPLTGIVLTIVFAESIGLINGIIGFGSVAEDEIDGIEGFELLAGESFELFGGR